MRLDGKGDFWQGYKLAIRRAVNEIEGLKSLLPENELAQQTFNLVIRCINENAGYQVTLDAIRQGSPEYRRKQIRLVYDRTEI